MYSVNKRNLVICKVIYAKKEIDGKYLNQFILEIYYLNYTKLVKCS